MSSGGGFEGVKRMGHMARSEGNGPRGQKVRGMEPAETKAFEGFTESICLGFRKPGEDRGCEVPTSPCFKRQLIQKNTSLVFGFGGQELEVVDLIGELGTVPLTAFRDDWRSISSRLSWSLPIHEIWLRGSPWEVFEQGIRPGGSRIWVADTVWVSG